MLVESRLQRCKQPLPAMSLTDLNRFERGATTHYRTVLHNHVSAAEPVCWTPCAQLLPGFHAQPVGVSPFACAPAPAFDCSPSPLLNPFGALIQPLGATMVQLLEYNQHHMRSDLCLVLRVAAAEMTFKYGELERVALESVAGIKERVAHEAGLKTRVRKAEAQLRKAEAATAAHAARVEEHCAAALEFFELTPNGRT